MRFNNLSEFVTSTTADLQLDGTYIVYLQPESKTGKIYFCEGKNEYEAKESAWEFYVTLFKELETQIKKK